ncbi:MAG: kinase/pyrophosphorylase [Gammaproteobacteria bacterium]|nr:kinase/pyrophosphorylase [Gammaproteobacteria bacterium]
MKRVIIYISDSTGITAETVGHSLLTQFPAIEFEPVTLRFVDNETKAHEAAALIDFAAEKSGQRPIVFSTLVEPEIRRIVMGSNGLFMDFMNQFLQPLADEFDQPVRPSVGHTHGQEQQYDARMMAVNFALDSDDGLRTQQYDKADIILTGVSRSGKTPTCVYLALHYGIFAANYPLVEEDLEKLHLPEHLKKHRQKLFGLTISAERLHRIRSERRPDSDYASLRQCQYEVRQVEALFRQSQIGYLDVSTISVEEIATHIMARAQLEQSGHEFTMPKL